MAEAKADRQQALILHWKLSDDTYGSFEEREAIFELDDAISLELRHIEGAFATATSSVADGQGSLSTRLTSRR